MSYNNKEYQYAYLTGASTNQVFTGKGILHYITVNAVGLAGSISIIDGIAGTTPNVGLITLSNSNIVTLHYDVYMATGLRIRQTNSPDITVCYEQG